jgi:hypothetical protein
MFSQMTCVRGGTYAGLASGASASGSQPGRFLESRQRIRGREHAAKLNYFPTRRVDKELLVELLGTIRGLFFHDWLTHADTPRSLHFRDANTAVKITPTSLDWGIFTACRTLREGDWRTS